MALFTITTNAQANQPPNQTGDLDIFLAYNTTHVFTLANFTTGTVPEYQDPEGDPLYSIQVTALPGVGVLELNNVAISINDEILVSDINAGNFTYVSDAAQTAGYEDSLMAFDIKDSGSLTFAGLTGSVDIHVEEQINNPPTDVGDNTLVTDFNTTIVFTEADFTTDTTPAYSDPEGDSAACLQVLTLPVNGTLQLNGVDVVINQEIDFVDIIAGNFTYVPDNTVIIQTNVDFEFQIKDSGSGLYTS